MDGVQPWKTACGEHCNGWKHVCVHIWHCFLSLSPSFPHLNPGANYWASHSVKCTAVVTVSAPWAVKFVCILTVGGFTPHPQPPPPLALHHSVQKNYRISPACQPQSDSVFIFFPPLLSSVSISQLHINQRTAQAGAIWKVRELA